MQWIAICGALCWAAIAVGAYYGSDYPLITHYLAMALVLLFGAAVLYGLLIRPVWLMIQKRQAGDSWGEALSAHGLPLGFFLVIIVPASLGVDQESGWFVALFLVLCFLKFLHFLGKWEQRRADAAFHRLMRPYGELLSQIAQQGEKRTSHQRSYGRTYS
jgi:hypothetical protein